MFGALLGLLGGGLASAGMLGGISPLLASALGSGLGTAAETGDLGEGLKAGIGGFLGGKVLGGLMGGTAVGTNAALMPGQQTVNGGLFGGGSGAMTQGTPLFNQPAAMQNLLPPPPSMDPAMMAANNAATTAAVNPGMGIDPSTAAGQAAANVSPGGEGFFGKMKGALGQGMEYGRTPEGIGVMLGSKAGPMLMQGDLFGKKDDGTGEQDSEAMYPEVRPPERRMRTPRAGYEPGIDPEFNYGIAGVYGANQLRGMAEGGMVKRPMRAGRGYAHGLEKEFDYGIANRGLQQAALAPAQSQAGGYMSQAEYDKLPNFMKLMVAGTGGEGPRGGNPMAWMFGALGDKIYEKVGMQRPYIEGISEGPYVPPTTEDKPKGMAKGGMFGERENPSRDFGTGNNAGGIDRHMTKTMLDRNMNWQAERLGMEPPDLTTDAYLKFRETNPAGNQIRAFLGKLSEEANAKVKAENNGGIASLQARQRAPMGPPPGYRPGIDPEFMYGRLPESRIGRNGVPLVMEMQGMAEGGEVGDKDVITGAIQAIKGMNPSPEIALAKFVAMYGEPELRKLVDRVQSGEFDDTVARFAEGENGMVRGPGGPTDDMVPARNVSNGEELMVADGEFVTRADSTKAMEEQWPGIMDELNKSGKKAPEAVKRRVAA